MYQYMHAISIHFYQLIGSWKVSAAGSLSFCLNFHLVININGEGLLFMGILSLMFTIMTVEH